MHSVYARIQQIIFGWLKKKKIDIVIMCKSNAFKLLCKHIRAYMHFYFCVCVNTYKNIHKYHKLA